MKNIYLNWCIDARRYVTLDDVYHPDCGTYSFNCDKRLELDDICSLIARLPPNVAIPIQMYASGYKYCEIADALDIPISCIRRRIRAARMYLKRMFDE